MNITDLVFTKHDIAGKHSDYWFSVNGGTREELADKYMEQSMITVTDIVYSEDEDMLGVKQLFPFNQTVRIVKDIELKNIILEAIKQINS